MPLPKHEHTGTDSNRVSYNNLKDKADVDDAVSKKHTQNADTALGAQTENLDMNTNKIVGVVDPTANQEAATKKYVDDNAGNPDYALGDILIISSDDITTTAYTDPYAKAKEIELARDGALRIKFDMKRAAIGGGESNIAYARIYKNGVALGTEQTTVSESYVTKSEDIAGWLKGDFLQLYIHGLSSPQTQCSVQNLRIYSSEVEVATVRQSVL